MEMILFIENKGSAFCNAVLRFWLELCHINCYFINDFSCYATVNFLTKKASFPMRLLEVFRKILTTLF